MSETPKPRLALIVGPTGVGKSELALRLGRSLKGEIINADSLALYRGFDIGTAKPSAEDRAAVPHHLVDVLEPDEVFDAAAYLKAARPVVHKLWSMAKAPLAVGGTGFYLRSLTRGLFEGPGRDEKFRAALAAEAAAGLDLHARLAAVDPETAARLAPGDRVRIERALEVHHLSGKPISQWQREHGLLERPFETLTIVLDRPVEELDERLRLRTALIYDSGLIAEVEGLMAAGWPVDLKPFGAIGYKEAVAHIKGELSESQAREQTFLATRRYAKRQRTWFRGQMPEALWFHPARLDEVTDLLLRFYA